VQAFELEEVKLDDPEDSPIDMSAPLAPVAGRILKRSNTLASLVNKVMNANADVEPAHLRARREADDADKMYRVSVRKLDRRRLALEETIESTLKTLQKWEAERLRAIKTGQ
jgi:hypothetical protein